MFRAEGYKYCNIACFYRVDVATFPTQNRNILVHWQDYANMKEFGNFVVIIKDAEDLIRRIDVAMQKNNFKYCVGDVQYYKDIEPDIHCMIVQTDESFDIRKLPQGQQFDSFYKAYKFANQNEWRISLYRGVKEEKEYNLDIGNLRDIACLTEIRHMPDVFNRLLMDGMIKPNWAHKYSGNISRDELRNLFIALGDYQAKLSLIVNKDYLTKAPPLQKGDFLERFTKRVTDTLNDFASKKINKEELFAELYRLRDVLKRSYTQLPHRTEV